ncbi:sensor histidine kinase [Dyadobacter arcticus]|uniref:LytS/YehU family sensor histidine kinase n=1 Tax=Dyadobacter arcticus TaxID=1078754 RepID=A0ABX0UIG7_9BACT|nr:histidine kinase [Dyadobacter arcticus]NIJ51006.1 LytS/YehU family sensor histidine kinase [Dyadobacter arcticus]
MSLWEVLTFPLSFSHYLRTFFITYVCLWILNRTFERKQYAFGVLGILFIYISHPFIRYAIEEVWFVNWLGLGNYFKGTTFSYYLTDNLFSCLMPVLISFVFKAVEDFFKNEKAKAMLREEKLITELQFLKSQVNPHFFFNTLNNIYSLVYQKSDEAPGAVLKLAEMMRYMLYESNVEKVDLVKELKYLDSYIDLQKLRYPGETFVNFETHGHINGQQIAPMLLIPLVENAFKHGDIQDHQHPLAISLQISGNNMQFDVENSKTDKNKDEAGGIGMVNVERRLNLIYPDRHSLQVRDETDRYSCELKLIL